MLLGGALLAGCGSDTGDVETVTLPAFSFLPPQPAPGAADQATVGRLIARSVWAVVPDQGSLAASSGAILGSAVAVSGDTLLASCEVAAVGAPVGVIRRSTYRRVRVTAREPAGRLCELRPADVWLRTVAGYRPFDQVQVGEPVLAVVSQTSRRSPLSVAQ